MSNSAVSDPTPPPPARLGATLGNAIKKRWRGWLRAIHRDVGYLAVGLTVIYAMSGLAINHIKDWDPNFHTYQRERTIAPIPADVPDDEAIARAEQVLHVGHPRSTYRAGDEIHLEWDDKKIVVYGDNGSVIEQGRKERFFLRVANWLHYNRGKKAWTYVADGYAILLLYLATSGLFMIKGKKGLRWRGAVLLALGAGVPLGYVIWSGGPEAANRASRAAAERAERRGSAEPAGVPDEPAGAGSEPSPPGDPSPPADDDAPMRPRVLKPPPSTH